MRDFLNSQEWQTLSRRITEFEEKTGCEIVYHLRKNLGSEPLIKAERLFLKYGLHKTKHRNTVFVCVAVKEHQFAIWVDKGIVRFMDDPLWAQITEKMSLNFKAGDRLKALTCVMDFAQDILSKEQPDHTKDGIDELSNTPITEDES